MVVCAHSEKYLMHRSGLGENFMYMQVFLKSEAEILKSYFSYHLHSLSNSNIYVAEIIMKHSNHWGRENDKSKY